MKSVIVSNVLLLILIIYVIVNSIYTYNLSTELLDISFSLPSDYDSILSLSSEETEKIKADINILFEKWDANSHYIALTAKFDEVEKINKAVFTIKECFFAGKYEMYLVERINFIHLIERQKHNELPVFENIF